MIAILKHPVDIRRIRHYCQDKNATAVSGRWLCHCPGGPYFTNDDLRIAHREQRVIDRQEGEGRGLSGSA